MASTCGNIGSNPRTYFGFKNQTAVKNHIKREQPGLYKCIGKIKTLKKAKPVKGSKARPFNRHLVYFRARKK